MNIVVKASDAISYGDKIIGYSRDLNDEIRKFDGIIDSINNVWEGADATKYINSMKDKYKLGLLEIKELLDDYGRYLKKAADAYVSLDEAFKTKNIDV